MKKGLQNPLNQNCAAGCAAGNQTARVYKAFDV